MEPTLIFILMAFLAGPFFLIVWLLTRKKLRDQIKVEEAAAKKLRSTLASAEAARSTMAKKFAPIISQEQEVARLQIVASETGTQIEKLRTSYAEKRTLLDRLEQQVAIYDEQLAFAELGVYAPHFDFTDSEEYKQRIIYVRDRQKSMISEKMATKCPTPWELQGSKSQGQTMMNRQTRLTMRAFNNECEAAIANARWNNVVAMEKRILAAESAINRENTSLNLTINPAYVSLKIEELRLTHEYREKLKVEKEERTGMARAEREERKIIAEAEAAEREERRYESLLEKARKEAGTGADMDRRISELETALAEAHAASQRARAMAEMTRSGYVYIISNVGSFGEDVVKIGLTRRLEPDDRVRELGDASVPFLFDTHAMIYSDEAPSLEGALHREFANRRINMSNYRKEFFRVSLDEVEAAVKRLAPSANFFKDREAQEWHETLARRKIELQGLMAKATNDFPTTI